VERAGVATPSSVAAPWGIILYADEILPGSQLAYRAARRLWGLYWNVLQFDSAVHSDEELRTVQYTDRQHTQPLQRILKALLVRIRARLQESWFEVLFAQTNLSGKVKGSVADLMRALTFTIFNPNTHDLRRSGMHVELATGRSVHLWMSLDIIIADETVLHSMFGCKKAGGLKPRLLCQDVFDSKDERAYQKAMKVGGCRPTLAPTVPN
jgi:hypothetical protein